MQHIGLKSAVGLVGVILTALAFAPQEVAQYLPDGVKGVVIVGAYLVGILAAYRHPAPTQDPRPDYIAMPERFRGETSAAHPRPSGRSMMAVLLVLALGSSILVTGCNRATPRHDTTISLSVLVTSMRALQNGELALYTAGTGTPTTDQHRAYNGKLVVAWGYVDDAVTLVEAWTPGAGTPGNLKALLAKVSDLIAADATTTATTRAFSADKSIAWLTALIQLVVAGKDAIVEIGDAIEGSGGTSDQDTLVEDNALLASLHAQIAAAKTSALVQAQAGS